MISVILYGRNDSHGYNLHRRAALSINCIAEVLTHPDDEILFVDWNTPLGFPTFPEAISDTLTEQAKSLLRIFKVPSAVHEQEFSAKTKMPTVETVARNVALRRSSEANRWILSTNTDMLFLVPGGSLSEVASSLADGFYELPRFDLPEVLWEQLPRSLPQDALETVKGWTRGIPIDHVVTSFDFIRFDAPGDFQLCLRSDLWEIGGFEEAMLRGWHVDSNLAKRLNLLRGSTESLEGFLRGYHCDHTRNLTAHHSAPQPPNDYGKFVYSVTSPNAIDRVSWGLPEYVIPEVRFGSRRAEKLPELLANEVRRPGEPGRTSFTSDRERRIADVEHALPWIVDPLIASPEVTAVGHIGWTVSPSLSNVLRQSGIQLFELSTADPSILKKIQAVVVDLGVPGLGGADSFDDEDPSTREHAVQILECFAEVVGADISSTPPLNLRYVVHNAVHNDFDWLVSRLIVTPGAQFNTRVRHGFPIPRKESRQRKIRRRASALVLRALDFMAATYKRVRRSQSSAIPVESRSSFVRIVWKLRGKLENSVVETGHGWETVSRWAKVRLSSNPGSTELDPTTSERVSS